MQLDFLHLVPTFSATGARIQILVFTRIELTTSSAVVIGLVGQHLYHYVRASGLVGYDSTLVRVVEVVSSNLT